MPKLGSKWRPLSKINSHLFLIYSLSTTVMVMVESAQKSYRDNHNLELQKVLTGSLFWLCSEGKTNQNKQLIFHRKHTFNYLQVQST
jgi:hypothetical protein